MIAAPGRHRLRPEESSAIGPDRKRCSNCLRVKPLAQFYAHATTRDGRGSWCKGCDRIAHAERRQTEAFRQWQAEYNTRPEVRRKKKARNTVQRAKRKAAQAAYRQTPRGRLLHNLRAARADLRRAERGMVKVKARIAAYEAEIARMDASLSGETAGAGRAP